MSQLQNEAFKELMRNYKSLRIWANIYFVAFIITLGLLVLVLIFNKGLID